MAFQPSRLMHLGAALLILCYLLVAPSEGHLFSYLFQPLNADDRLQICIPDPCHDASSGYGVQLFCSNALNDLIDIQVNQSSPVIEDGEQIFASNKPVTFSGNLSALGRWERLYRLYGFNSKWTISERGDHNSSAVITNTSATFEHVFSRPGRYNILLEMSTVIRCSQLFRAGLLPFKAGSTSKQIQVYEPISRLAVSSREDFVMDDTTELTVNCNGSGNISLCYYIAQSSLPVPKPWCSSCEQILQITSCPHQVTVELDEVKHSGVQYIHVGLQNAVSEQWTVVAVYVQRGVQEYEFW